MMKISVFTFIISFATIFISCKEKEVPSIDLTSQLEGEFNIENYMVLNQDNGTIISESQATSINNKLKFTKKNNNTLTVYFSIKDANVEVNETFDVVVNEDRDQSDHFGRSGLLANYRLTYKNSDKNKEFNCGISFYKNGDILGGLPYVKGKQYISVGFSIN